MATPMLLFDEAEVLPYRYTNVEFQRTNQHDFVRSETAQAQGKRLRKDEVCFQYVTVLSHIVVLCSLYRPGSRKSSATHQLCSASCELLTLVLTQCYNYGMSSSS